MQKSRRPPVTITLWGAFGGLVATDWRRGHDLHMIGIWLPILECNQFGVREPPVPPPVLALDFLAEAAGLAAPPTAY